MLSLGQIHLYPLKSARGLAVPCWELGPRGLRLDRHWMVVDAAGDFISQRTVPRLNVVYTELAGDTLRLSAPGMRSVEVLAEPGPTRIDVRVWKDQLPAAPALEASAWMSELLGMPCTVVAFPPEVARQVDPTYASPGDVVGFADGFSLLLIGDGSLAELNTRLRDPLPATRFRPNLVIAGCEPFAEDTWRRIRVGGLELEVVKPCARCSITTVDENGVPAKEPLATLARFRRSEQKVLFGQNLVHRGTGTLRVGDEVTVLS